MPANLLEVMLRRDEIVYTDRVRNDLRFEDVEIFFPGHAEDALDARLVEIGVGAERNEIPQQPGAVDAPGKKHRGHVYIYTHKNTLSLLYTVYIFYIYI